MRRNGYKAEGKRSGEGSEEQQTDKEGGRDAVTCKKDREVAFHLAFVLLSRAGWEGGFGGLGGDTRVLGRGETEKKFSSVGLGRVACVPCE